ncbi:hypothetical protein [Pontimicrobium sp. MEBiC06410]
MIKLKTADIKEIKKISSELGLTTRENVEKFNEKIHAFLHKKLYGRSDYLYSTLLFVKNGDIINHQFFLGTKIETSHSLAKYIKYIQKKLSSDLRDNNSTIGISNEVIKSKINGIVLYKNDENDSEFTAKAGEGIDLSYNLGNVEVPKEAKKRIFNQNVKQIEDELKSKNFYIDFIQNKESLNSLKAEFKINNTHLLNPILSLYYLSIPDNNSNFYSYFIKPDTSHDYYNGLFNLTLTRALKSDELATLNLILFYIFSEIALKDTSNQIEREVNEKYQVELAHIINGNLGKALNLLNNETGEFLKDKVEVDNIEVLYKLLKRTERRSKIFLDLYNKERELLDYNIIQFESIPFAEIIEDALENNVSNNMSKIRANKILALTKSNKFDYLKNLTTNNQFDIEESIELVLYNALHNGIKFSEDLNNFNITIKEELKSITIVITNDKKMELNLVDSINNDFKHIEKIGFGLVTIKKVWSFIKNLSIKVDICDKGFTNFKIIIKNGSRT